jgi:hypothetical protein
MRGGREGMRGGKGGGNERREGGLLGKLDLPNCQIFFNYLPNFVPGQTGKFFNLR